MPVSTTKSVARWMPPEGTLLERSIVGWFVSISDYEAIEHQLAELRAALEPLEALTKCLDRSHFRYEAEYTALRGASRAARAVLENTTGADMSRDTTVSISGIWLRKSGNRVQVLAESKGKDGKHWFLVIEEHENGSYSHIAEPGKILDSPVDPLEIPKREYKGGPLEDQNRD